WLVNRLVRDDDHRRLQIVHRPREPFAIRYARFEAQVGRSHFPLLAQDSQHSECRLAQALLLFTPRYPPERSEKRYHSWREEHCFAASQFAVVNATASHHLIFQYPRMRAFRIFLWIARHGGVAPTADSHIKRRPRLPRIGKARSKPDTFDKLLCLCGRLDTRRIFTTPMRITVFLNFGRKQTASSMPSHLTCRSRLTWRFANTFPQKISIS